MRISMLRAFPAALVAFLMLGATWASAQQVIERTPPDASPPLQTQPAQPRPAGNLESILIRALIEANQGEVQISQLGQKQAQSPQVQQFAQQMVREHTDLINQLQNFQARGAGGQQVLTPPAPGAPPPPADATRQARAPQVQATAVDSSLAAIFQQCNKRHLELVQQNLSQHQGLAFDQAFMNQEIAAHLSMLAMLETFQQHVSPQARQLVQAGIKHTQHHLTQARTLEQQVTSRLAQQPDAPTRR